MRRAHGGAQPQPFGCNGFGRVICGAVFMVYLIQAVLIEHQRI
jgi:hypothetical protein